MSVNFWKSITNWMASTTGNYFLSLKIIPGAIVCKQCSSKISFNLIDWGDLVFSNQFLDIIGVWVPGTLSGEESGAEGTAGPKAGFAFTYPSPSACSRALKPEIPQLSFLKAFVIGGG